MAGGTVANLREVEDSAPRFGFAPDMEARFARTALGCEQTGVSLQRLAPNVRGPFGHRHERQEEIYVVVAGGGCAKLDDEVVELRPWDALRVAPEVMRGFEAGPEGLEVIAFGAPSTGERDATVASGTGAAGNTINGCTKDVNGQLRVLKAGGRCLPSETPVSWSVTGPKGDTGPQVRPGRRGRPRARRRRTRTRGSTRSSS